MSIRDISVMDFREGQAPIGNGEMVERQRRVEQRKQINLNILSQLCVDTNLRYAIGLSALLAQSGYVLTRETK